MNATPFLDAAEERPAALRMRPDLEVYSQAAEGRPVWVIKDPLALEYRRLDAEEFAILSMLDGRTSLRAIRDAFERRFAPQRLSFARLEQFLARLHREGLVISDAPGQGARLRERAARRRWSVLLQVWTNPLAIRFRGVDPERFLQAVDPYTRWLFSMPAVLAGMLLIVAAAVLGLARWDDLAARLPRAAEWLRAENLALLALTLAITKTLHELGHALTCKRFGAECHEFGLMLLVFTPCLYCDVSDSWTLPGRWRRAAIAAAGVYVELVLAALAGLGWWFSRPGLFHSLCLMVLVVCSVGTVALNANPLLRYDGYYLLSDALGVANLRQRSLAIVRHALARWCLGWRERSDRFLPRRRGWLALYAVASTLYLWFITAAILWWLYRLLEPHGLGAAASLLAAAVLGRLLWTPAAFAARVASSPIERRRIHKGRLAVTVACLAGVLLAAAWIPAPQRVSAPAVLLPAGAQYVFVTAPGNLAEAAAPGTTVRGGETLGRLVAHEVEREITELESRHNELRRRLEHLETERRQSDAALAAQAAAALPATRQSLADVAARLEQRRRDSRRLVLTAPGAGAVIPPPRRAEAQPSPDQLGAWEGTPLDEQNRGCYLETGTLFCLVGDPARLEAVATVPAQDAGLIGPEQRVRLKFDGLPGQVLEGVVSQAARRHEARTAENERLELWRPRTGTSLGPEAVYYARIRLAGAPPALPIGARGTARILVAPQTWGERLARWTARTFRFGG